MKTKITALVIMLLYLMIASSVFAEGYLVTSDLWIKAVINTVEKGPIEAVFYSGGEKTTSRGDKVIWGYFYASPDDVSWGDQGNPDLYVKIWFDVSGRIDVNYFHVSVPDIEVYSDYPYDGTWDQHGTTTMDYRYIRHEYWTGTQNGRADLSGTWDRYESENGGAETYLFKMILVHDDNTLYFYRLCGILDSVFTKSGNTVQKSYPDATHIGTINSNNNEISGTWSEDGQYGTFRLVKISNSTTFTGSGSLVIQGQLCNQTINVNTTVVCTEKGFDNGELDELWIGAPYNSGWIGIELESPELLASYTTFDIQSDNFKLDLEGTIVEDCYGDEVRSSSGTVTIDIYDGTRLKGSFAVVFDGSNLTGSFDVSF